MKRHELIMPDDVVAAHPDLSKLAKAGYRFVKVGPSRHARRANESKLRKLKRKLKKNMKEPRSFTEE
jgi:hypothetical protein